MSAVKPAGPVRFSQGEAVRGWIPFDGRSPWARAGSFGDLRGRAGERVVFRFDRLGDRGTFAYFAAGFDLLAAVVAPLGRSPPEQAMGPAGQLAEHIQTIARVADDPSRGGGPPYRPRTRRGRDRAGISATRGWIRDGGNKTRVRFPPSAVAKRRPRRRGGPIGPSWGVRWLSGPADVRRMATPPIP